MLSVKVKISYTEDRELSGIIQKLHPAVKSVKVQPPKGKFKRAYIGINSSSLCADLVMKKCYYSQKNQTIVV